MRIYTFTLDYFHGHSHFTIGVVVVCDHTTKVFPNLIIENTEERSRERKTRKNAARYLTEMCINKIDSNEQNSKQCAPNQLLTTPQLNGLMYNFTLNVLVVKQELFVSGARVPVDFHSFRLLN